VQPGDVLLCYGKMAALKGLARGQKAHRRGAARAAAVRADNAEQGSPA
jgi:hypothetical protein